MPGIDEGARQRRTARFGSAADLWSGQLPGLLAEAAGRWQLEFRPAIPRGSVSADFWCRLADGRRAVLKASPDRARLAFEAAALAAWPAVHTPAVIAHDARLGVLVIEAIDPGTPLDLSAAYPAAHSIAELMGCLHEGSIPGPSFPPAAQRVAYLSGSGATLYDRHPELAALIPPRLYQRGHDLAARLARHHGPAVLLHGDLTPANILHGAAERGLVAIEPAPCLGDPAFDAVDLILWQADALETIQARTQRLAAMAGIDADRIYIWCTAFAAMAALDLASQANGHSAGIQALLELASQA